MSRIINKEKSELIISYTLEGEELQTAFEKAKKSLRANITVPGFRKGKAPEREADKRISFSEILDKALSSNIDSIYEKHIKAEIQDNDEIIGKAKLTLGETDNPKEKVIIEFVFPLMPEVKLGSYKNLDIKLGSLKLTNDEVQSTELQLLSDYVALLDTDDAIAKEDTVNFDFKGYVDGKPFDGGDAEGFDLKIGSGQFIPGFEDKMIGLKKGEEKDLELEFPKNYHVNSLAGKPVTFHVKINFVKRPNFPEITEQFIKEINLPGVETLDEYKNEIKAKTYSEKLSKIETEFTNLIIQKLVESSKINVPDSLVKQEAEKYYANFINNLKQQEILEKEYLEFTNNTKEDVLKTFDESAILNLKKSFILNAIAKAEKISLSQEEYLAECQRIADLYKIGIDGVKSILKFENVENRYINEHVIDLLISYNDKTGFEEYKKNKAFVKEHEESKLARITEKARAREEEAKKAKEKDELKKVENK
ncbi:trigger factor [Metamycoplasma equirhinis]|uniref:trigger factor n=1 Tax=Metamycoplasma equirhinis TaxID=92402 RepID=UPI00359C81A3